MVAPVWKSRKHVQTTSTLFVVAMEIPTAIAVKLQLWVSTSSTRVNAHRRASVKRTMTACPELSVKKVSGTAMALDCVFQNQKPALSSMTPFVVVMETPMATAALQEWLVSISSMRENVWKTHVIQMLIARQEPSVTPKMAIVAARVSVSQLLIFVPLFIFQFVVVTAIHTAMNV